MVTEKREGYALRDVDMGVVVKLGPGRQAGNGTTMLLQVRTARYARHANLPPQNPQNPLLDPMQLTQTNSSPHNDMFSHPPPLPSLYSCSSLQLAPGDRVKFRDYAGANVKLEGLEHAIIRACDILAKVEG